MRRLKLAAWLTFCLAGAIAVFALQIAPARERVAEARQSYEEARTALETTSTERQRLETRLRSLQTNVEAVELGARLEYRLIKPGERLELIDHKAAE